ncbi:MAG: diguanylate cyclase, partial [Mobilitalea sp.]
MSIKKSLRILLIISSMIPVVLMSVIVYILLTSRLNDINSNNLQQIAEANKSGLEAMIDIQRTEVSLLAIQNELVGLVKSSNNSSNYSPNKANKLLSIRGAGYESCEYISLFNVNKEIVACSDSSLIGTAINYDTSIKYLYLTRKIVIGASGLRAIAESGQTIYTIDIGCPIIDSTNNAVIGYVISTISTSYFNNFLKSISFGETGSGILLDRSGTIIYHPNSSLIGQNINSEKLSRLLNDYNTGIIPASGSFDNRYDNISRSYGYCILPDLDWVLLVRQDLSEIHSPTNIVPAVLFGICTGILFLVLIFSNALAKSISEPIVSLRDAMRTASNGNLTIQSNIKSNNELGELSKNFNKMLHIIKTNYEDLASMHDELLSNEEQLRSNYDHIEFLAYHDTLTNLPNKLAFLDYVNAVLASSSSHQKTHAVYFVDLDNFKAVNDTLGHEYGDALLVKTAQLLTSILGENGMLARAGGDEFLLFKEDLSFKENAVEFAAQVIDCFRNPLDLDGETVHVSMSIGISLYPENGISSNTLIKNSDIAMYKSKDTGKNKYTLFDLIMEEELSRNTIIIEILRNAITSREIYIKYQPLVELESNSV